MKYSSKYPLVSLITPCYNGEQYIERLLKSVLHQSYPNIEYYIVDDGSTDNTAMIIKSYINKFRDRGYCLTYIYQANSGQSVAINNALKLVKGEYLLWPDADDYYSSTLTIEKLYLALANGGESYAASRCFLKYVDESENLVGINPSKSADWGKTNLFSDMLSGSKNFWYCSGGYMIRLSALKESMTSSDIYTAKNAGQNFQLLFPILYNYLCITVPEILYSVYTRSDSHSRSVTSSCDKNIKIIDTYYDTAIETLKCMKMSLADLNKYSKLYRDRYLKDKFRVYCKFKRRKEAILCLLKTNCIDINTLSCFKSFLVSFIPRVKK